ncbi:MAG TPA: M14 family zinc carboxypeptidase [Planctomicrobium sp.]|nr:M14 family zinc carboxypeptidase [Planctomicrobium sp.]
MLHQRSYSLIVTLVLLIWGGDWSLARGQAGELTTEDFRFDGEYGSEGAQIEQVGRNHFRIRLKKVPENPNWTNMVQFIIEKNAAGNPLRVDIEGRTNETGLRTFVSWSHDRENWSPVLRETREESGTQVVSLLFPEFKEDVVYVGGEVPLSYEQCVKLLKKYEQHPHATLHSIGRSLREREIYRLTITDPGSPVPEEKRWAHHFVNLHCYEYNAQWRMIGMIDWLLSNEALDSRQRHVWHFVVQMNVDGASAGYGRVNSQGIDMNRSYSSKGSDSQSQAYEAFLVQRDLEDLVSSDTSITTTCEMHTWDGEKLDPMMRPGKDMQERSRDWTGLRDSLKKFDKQGQFNSMAKLPESPLYPTQWCSGTFAQFEVTAICFEGGGNIYHLKDTLLTGKVIAQAYCDFYSETKP